jgi:hypothetical protein
MRHGPQRAAPQVAPARVRYPCACGCPCLDRGGLHPSWQSASRRIIPFLLANDKLSVGGDGEPGRALREGQPFSVAAAGLHHRSTRLHFRGPSTATAVTGRELS